MFEYSLHEGRVATWVWAQLQKEHRGIFPPAKGWQGHLEVAPLNLEGQSAYQWNIVGEEESYLLLTLGSLAEEATKLDLKNWYKNQPQATQKIIIAGQRQAGMLVQTCKDAKLPLLAIHSDRAEFMLGAWENKRLEFRMQEDFLNPENLPRLIPPFPSRHSCGEEALPLFQGIFHQINLALCENKSHIAVEKALAASIPIWELLPKKEKKAIFTFCEQRLLQMEQQFFSGLWNIKEDQKKKQSHPKLELYFQKGIKTPKGLAVIHKAEQAALRWLRLEQPQLSLNEEIKPSQ